MDDRSQWPAEMSLIRTASPVGGVVMAKTQPIAATLSRDHQLRIVAWPSGTERRAIDLGDREIDVFAISPDGRAVVIGDHKGRVSVWATDTGASRLELQLRRYPGLAVFSQSGAVLALTSQGDPVQLIDLATGKAAATLGTPGEGTNALALSRDDRLVATGDGDGAIRVHDAHTGRLIAENREFLMTPLAVAFTADGRTVIAGSGDLARTAQPAALLDVSPDGKWLAAAFMKAENMSKPDHVLILSTDLGQQQLDWLPPVLPAGGGWTDDGRMLVAIPSPEGLHLWRLH
jgi:DNA-binding beta-propeller fold protein YncE